MTWRCNRLDQQHAILQKVGREAGFTLIEVLISLSILGLALTLITGYRPPWSNRLGLQAAAGEISSGLRWARSEAILRNRIVRFEIDLAKRQYRVNGMAAKALPPRLAIELLTVRGERRSNDVGDIRFNPDGSSTGGRISLDDGTRRVSVGIDWLSGRVSVADVR